MTTVAPNATLKQRLEAKTVLPHPEPRYEYKEQK